MSALVAIDDGHSQTKVAWHTAEAGLQCTGFPSRVQRGTDARKGRASIHYLCAEERTDSDSVDRFTLVDHTVPTRIDNRYRDFPISPQNRVLVHHAMGSAVEAMRDGDATEPHALDIGTTLPFASFYDHQGQPNAEGLEAKKQNIAGPCWRIDPQTGQGKPASQTIAGHTIHPEGVSAFWDIVCEIDPSGEVGIVSEVFERFQGEVKPFLIVDIGGKTTDVIRASWSSDSTTPVAIDPERSDSLNIGVLDAVDILRFRLRSEDVDVNNVTGLERSLISNTVWISQAERDVERHTSYALRMTAANITDQLKPLVDDQDAYTAVLICGGGASLMPQLTELFSAHLLYTVDEPRFSNARGVLKMKLMQQQQAGE